MLMAADSKVICQTTLEVSEVIRDGHLKFDSIFVKMEAWFLSLFYCNIRCGYCSPQRAPLCGFDG